jgi:hypothetical protein
MVNAMSINSEILGEFIDIAMGASVAAALP